MASHKKIILSSVLGNALEFYDFTLYGVFTVVLANHYFPGDNSTANLLFSLAAFAVGCLTRPLGAILFGHMGDNLGRKEALSFSILLMGIPTFCIGIAPTYQEVGIAASILVFVCRLLQGLFTGGEYNGAAIFTIEHLGKKYPGFIGGIITGSCVIGSMIATLLGAWTQSPGMPSWAWRLPFIFGGLIGLFGYFMRRNMMETPEFSAFPCNNRKSFAQAIITHFRPSLISLAFGSFNGTLTYTLFGFLNVYLFRYLHIPLVTAIQLNLVGLFCFMVGSPLMGYLLDIFGQKRFLSCAIAGIFSLMLPIFLLFSTKTIIALLLGQILLGLCTASIAGSGHAIMQRLFPVGERYRGIAFNFNLGIGFFGGITPIIYVHMIEQLHFSLLCPAIFLMGCTLLFGSVLVMMNFFTRKAVA
ncbi:MAG: MFS transporter [Rhabdochlamydiaceae bacterium]|nr:MFS transporter [Rhabdochlamydiaceae bacterium]